MKENKRKQKQIEEIQNSHGHWPVFFSAQPRMFFSAQRNLKENEGEIKKSKGK